MKLIIAVVLATFFYNLSYAQSIDATLKVLNRVYTNDTSAFLGAKIGVERGITQYPISQENIVAELERELFFDQGFCEYKTVIGVKENITLIEKSVRPKAARIFRKLRNDGAIEHISSRVITLQKTEAECSQKYIRIVLIDGSLIWLCLLYTSPSPRD